MLVLFAESRYWNAKLMKSDILLTSIFCHSFGQVLQCSFVICLASIFGIFCTKMVVFYYY